MDSWKRVCYKRPIACYFKTSLSGMAARNPVYLVTKDGIPISKERGTIIHNFQNLSKWKMLLSIYLKSVILGSIAVLETVWKTLMTFTISSKLVRRCYLNFLIFTPLGKEMEDFAGFYVVICFLIFHLSQLQCTTCGLIPPKTII